jgi:energy-coupling factor transporter ATP-binding protein EcfA2
MKISGIQTSNFLGARAVDIALKKPVALIAGHNGAGKSSIRDAIALAFTADLGRISLKKDAANLISEGGDSCFVEIATDTGNYGVAITAAGKISDTMADKETPAALPYVLDAQRFARMADNDRRQFLFGLMGVKLDGPAIKKRLLAKGYDEKRVEQIMPILRAGFEAASNEASSKARDAKASWRTATGGETWGKDKAGNWQPAALPLESEKASARYENAVAKRNEVDAELATAQQELGAARAEQKRQHEAEAQRLELHAKASNIERFTKKLKFDLTELAAWEQKVADCKANAGVAQPNPKEPGEYLLRGLAVVTDDFLTLSMDFPDVDWPSELINRAAVHLAEYKKLHGWPHSKSGLPDQDAIAKLPEYEKALDLVRSSVENDRRDLATAEQAAATLKNLDGLKATADVDGLATKVTELTEVRNNWQADADKYRDVAEKHTSRTALVEQVAKLHADVMAWTDIADSLAPNGIPAELLKDALGPINEHLRVSAANAEWEPAQINADMSITYGLRDYPLISESEKWRADAMIAEAVSHLSGMKLLVLDRFDVLDMKGREDLLYWLDGMAQDGDINSALIFGTLKSLPAINFETIEAHWIDNGTAGQMKEAA